MARDQEGEFVIVIDANKLSFSYSTVTLWKLTFIFSLLPIINISWDIFNVFQIQKYCLYHTQ